MQAKASRWVSAIWLAPFWQRNLFQKGFLEVVLFVLDVRVLCRRREDAEVCAGLSLPETRVNRFPSVGEELLGHQVVHAAKKFPCSESPWLLSRPPSSRVWAPGLPYPCLHLAAGVGWGHARQLHIASSGRGASQPDPTGVRSVFLSFCSLPSANSPESTQPPWQASPRVLHPRPTQP